jgi:hypothetical protein
MINNKGARIYSKNKQNLVLLSLESFSQESDATLFIPVAFVMAFSCIDWPHCELTL